MGTAAVRSCTPKPRLLRSKPGPDAPPIPPPLRRYQEGLLASLASLAHRLDASGLLARIEAYLQSG